LTASSAGATTRVPQGRALHGQTPVMGDDRLHLGQLDALVQANRLGWLDCDQRRTAAGALLGTMVEHRVGLIASHSAVALVTGFGTARFGLLPLLLAIRRGRFGRGPRGLLRSLQPQHQFNQFLAAQPLKFAATHLTMESAKTDPRKGVGNYAGQPCYPGNVG